MSYLDDNQKKIAALYVAAYDRAPDLDGLTAWTNSLEEAGGTTAAYENIAEQFVSVALFDEIYDTSESNRVFVESVYLNLFGEAGDQVGIDAWTNSLDNDGVSKGVFLTAFLGSALGYEEDPDEPLNAKAMAHKAILENKIDVSLYYVNELGQRTNVTTPGDVTDPAYVRSVEAIEGVTDDVATVTAAKGVIAEWVAEGQPGDTFTLTAGIDNLTGTAGNDTFNAPLTLNEFQSENKQTLNSGDQVNGGGGNNVLNATLNDSAKPVLENVQTVNVKAVGQTTGAANIDLDLAASTGVEQINIDGVVFGTDITGVQDANVAISNLKTGSVSLANIEGKDFTLGLDNVGAKGKDKAATIALAADTSATKALENLTIANGAAASFVDLTGLSDTKTVEATGDGNLNVDLSDAENLKAVTTGAGDDKVTVDVGVVNGDAAKANVIDLGEGNDTLVVKGNITTDINLSQSAGTENPREIAELKGVNNLELNGAVTGDVKLKDSGFEDGITFSGVGTATTINNASNSFELGLKDTGDADNDTVAAVIQADTVSNLTVNAEGISALTFKQVVLSAEENGGVAATKTKLSTLSVNDTSEQGNAEVTVTLAKETATGTLENLRTIDLNGQEDTVFKVGFDGEVGLVSSDTSAAKQLTVNIGEAKTVDYTAAVEAKIVTSGSDKVIEDGQTVEVFKFTDASFESVTITNFGAGKVAEDNVADNDLDNTFADKLDLTGLGITGMSDLEIGTDTIDVDGSATDATIITAKDGQFDGTITLIGVVLESTTTGGLVLTDDNFIF